jgi:hypothetical protein
VSDYFKQRSLKYWKNKKSILLFCLYSPEFDGLRTIKDKFKSCVGVGLAYLYRKVSSNTR